MGFDSSVWVFYYPEDLIWCRCSVICKPSCSWQTSGDFLPCYDNILHFAKQLDCFDVVSKSRRTYLPICDPFFVGMCKRRMFTNTQSGSFLLLSVEVLARSSIVPSVSPMKSKNLASLPLYFSLVMGAFIP